MIHPSSSLQLGPFHLRMWSTYYCLPWPHIIPIDWPCLGFVWTLGYDRAGWNGRPCCDLCGHFHACMESDQWSVAILNPEWCMHISLICGLATVSAVTRKLARSITEHGRPTMSVMVVHYVHVDTPTATMIHSHNYVYIPLNHPTWPQVTLQMQAQMTTHQICEHACMHVRAQEDYI